MTEHEPIQEALREFQKKFLSLFRESPLVLEITNAKDDRYIEVNDTFQRITGWTREEVVGRTPYDLNIMVDPSQRVNFVRQLLSGDTVQNLELHGRMKNGEIRTGSASAALIEIDGETCILTVIEDTTDLKRAEEAKQVAQRLSDIVRKLLQVNEEEHASIVRELHNYLDCLALLSIALDRLGEESSESRADVEEVVGEARQHVLNLFGDIRMLSHRLRSPKLEYLGLAAAAASFCKDLSDQRKIEIDFESEGVPKDLPYEVSLSLYRVLQEAVQNAANYSGSQRLQVLLWGGSNELYLTVRDWGIGFDHEEALKGPALGLTTMKEWLKLVHGDLSIESQPEHGTTIHARVPLRERADAATTPR
jgi:PAS domain S-box-containing protein